MLRCSIPLLPILFLLGGFFAGHIVLLTTLIVLLYILWSTYAETWLPNLLWWPISLIASALIAIHYLPGFIPLRLFPWNVASAVSPVQIIWLPWDKTLVALTLSAWWLRQPKQLPISLDITALVFCLTFFVVPLLSIITNAASWRPKWPNTFWWWLVLNVGVVSLAEEGFFRGLLQTQLIRYFGTWLGIITTTLAYSALHLLVNPVYALLAGIAGLGYGMVLHFSKRLSLAVLLHASINTLHFLLLSYPFRLISE